MRQSRHALRPLVDDLLAVVDQNERLVLLPGTGRFRNVPVATFPDHPKFPDRLLLHRRDVVFGRKVSVANLDRNQGCGLTEKKEQIDFPLKNESQTFSSGGGLQRTGVEFLLLTQHPQVRILAFPKIFL